MVGVVLFSFVCLLSFGTGGRGKKGKIIKQPLKENNNKKRTKNCGYLPPGHADVPGSSEESGQSQKSSFTHAAGICN